MSHFFSRICFNSRGWQEPSGDAAKLEGPKNYVRKYGFGHEEWLLWPDLKIGGWRYGFLQGIENANKRRLSEPFDITLFTIVGKNVRRYVVTIYEVQWLDEALAAHAVKTFEKEGLLKRMREQVQRIGGKVSQLDSTRIPQHLFNVRFRESSIQDHGMQGPPVGDPMFRGRDRYKLFDFAARDRDIVGKGLARRRGHKGPIKPRTVFRSPTPASEYSIEHWKMQKKLVRMLQKKYGKERVIAELDYVDVTVITPTGTQFYEIKSDKEPRSVIRHALGQLLEYAYYPGRKNAQPPKLFIVGRNPLDRPDRLYLNDLKTRFRLDFEYIVVRP